MGNFLYICTGFATYKYIIMTKKNKLALVKRDILDNDKGILTFVDPLYRIWLKG